MMPGMAVERSLAFGLDALSRDQRSCWVAVLDQLVSVLPDRSRLVLVDGLDERAALLADRFAERLRDAGRPCVRLTGEVCRCDEEGWQNLIASAVVVADGPVWRDRLPGRNWEMTVWARTNLDDYSGGRWGENGHAVVDLHDPDWPVLRHLDPTLTPRRRQG